MQDLRNSLKLINWSFKLKKSKFNDKKHIVFYHSSGLDTNANVFTRSELVFILELKKIIDGYKFDNNKIYGNKF